jgi:pimeloyl-ACP methyl ester carboxylesterase
LLPPAILLLVIAAGCGVLRDPVEPTPLASAPEDVVFVADGAGDFRMASKALRCAVAETETPLQVVTFVWSHGYCRSLADQCDHAYAEAQGRRLAERVAEWHALHPPCRVSLVGHSAGCAVILAAVEAVQPGIVQRVILLSPSVPASYDLRPALANVGEEIDVHCSDRDSWDLGTVVRFLYCLEGVACPASGCGGFQAYGSTPEDAACYAKLRHFRWNPWVSELTGHDGGHYGCERQAYLRRMVLPSLMGKA